MSCYHPASPRSVPSPYSTIIQKADPHYRRAMTTDAATLGNSSDLTSLKSQITAQQQLIISNSSTMASKRSTVYVAGLPTAVNEDQLLETFVTFGDILEISMPTEPHERELPVLSSSSRTSS